MAWLAVALLQLAACGRPAPMARPTLDTALRENPATALSFDFAQAKPTILPAHQVELLTRFEGVTRGNCPDELEDEVNTFEHGLTREQLHDSGTYFPNHVPQDWKPLRTWYAGEMQGPVNLRYITIDGATFAIGALANLDERTGDKAPIGSTHPGRTSLGWSSTADPAHVNWIERDFLLPEFAQVLAFDSAQRDHEIVVVCAVPEGLREYAFEVRAGELVETRRRSVGWPKAFSPMLLEVGPELLLFWSEHTAESSRPPSGGVARRVARLTAGTSEWSAPATVTIDLDNAGNFAVCARGEQVSAAWSDNRFLAVGWESTNGRKLCVSRSTDHGTSWSAPVLLHDPEDNGVAADGRVLVYDDGVRILVLNAEGTPVQTKAGTVADTFLLSRDLTRWAPAPGRMFGPLVSLRKSEIARWPR
ncbi:MAG: exo-alpha-sialidase [Planctomycetes bacterium]|nr:exo-alpha-sialidase [Planctomycetota bacterium]